MSSELQSFVAWFQAQGGVIDTSVMDVTSFPGHGRGAIALKEIPEGHTLFTIPRTLTLSVRNCALPGLVGEETWSAAGLDEGWVGLILCMMWEEAKGNESRWAPYLESIPNTFETPMFWPVEDLEELKGTSVVEKIGRDDAEAAYHSKLVPTLQSRTDLFPASNAAHYSIERYHAMGSRILSRSFGVEKWNVAIEGAAEEEEQEEEKTVEPPADEEEAPVDVDTSMTSAQSLGSGMDVDHDDEENAEEGDGDSDSEEEDEDEVSMVPMADLLNARFGCENAKLFYEEHALRMVSTKVIPAGEQIWNTYGDPPNADLLRRYGHVDVLPLPDGTSGNPADVVEVRADLVVQVIARHHSEETRPAKMEQYKERIEWWLEEGGDDVFIMENDKEVPTPLPEAFTSIVRLLSMSQNEWEKTQAKGKPPKPKIDKEVATIAVEVIQLRAAEYPTTFEHDQTLLATSDSLPLNKRNALVVRHGEKRVLCAVLARLERMLEADKVREAKEAKEKAKALRERQKAQEKGKAMENIKSQKRKLSEAGKPGQPGQGKKAKR